MIQGAESPAHAFATRGTQSTKQCPPTLFALHQCETPCPRSFCYAAAEGLAGQDQNKYCRRRVPLHSMSAGGKSQDCVLDFTAPTNCAPFTESVVAYLLRASSAPEGSLREREPIRTPCEETRIHNCQGNSLCLALDEEPQAFRFCGGAHSRPHLLSSAFVPRKTRSSVRFLGARLLPTPPTCHASRNASTTPPLLQHRRLPQQHDPHGERARTRVTIARYWIQVYPQRVATITPGGAVRLYHQRWNERMAVLGLLRTVIPNSPVADCVHLDSRTQETHRHH